MKYSIFKVGDKEYKLRLTAQNTVNTEERLNKSILSVLQECESGSLPLLKELIIILQGALEKYEKEITLEETYEIYDDYVDDGHDITDLIIEITKVLQVSGFFKGQATTVTAVEKAVEA